MKKLVLKATALAIGALVAGAASAAPVDLDGTITTIKYASERVVSGTVNLRNGAAADQRATTAFGASFGTDVAAYVRIDIAGGTFAGTPAATMFAVNDVNGNAANVSVAQSSSTYVIFAVTPVAGESLAAAETATIDTDTGTATGINVTTKAGVTLRYRLFETLTAAANPATNNTLKDTDALGYIAFSSALSTTITSLTKTADVAASPSYTAFTSNTGGLAKIAVALASVAEPDGSALTAAELLTANSDITLTGNFEFLANDAGTYTGAALSRIWLNDNDDCTNVSATVAAASTLSATTAVFTDIAAATIVDDHWVCVTPEGTPEIAAGTFNADINYDAQTNYSVADVSGSAAGTIDRNGVRMVAPLVQAPTGWISRLVLTNTGTSTREYTIRYVSENGVTVTPTGAASSGTLAAGKTSVVDLSSLLAFAGGAPRTSLVVTVNAPQSEIDGLYQIVGPNSSVSNHILSYK